jgi:hypothetical protein
MSGDKTVTANFVPASGIPHTITLVYTGPENPVGGVDNMSVTATVLDEYGNPVGGIDLASSLLPSREA